MKVCNKCLIKKEISEFSKDSHNKDGHKHICKKCVKEYRIKNKEKQKSYNKEYRINNKEKIKKYDIKNKEKLQSYQKEYNIKNREKFKEYYIKNREKKLSLMKEYHIENREKELSRKKEYYIKNREKFNEYYIKNKEKTNSLRKEYYIKNREKSNEYVRNKRLNDPIFKLKQNVRCRLRKYLKTASITKSKKTFDIVGYSPPELKEYLEKQFVDGMSWERMGKEIHIDHIIPLSSANNEDEIYKLCHYSNLQPLWAKDNLSKGSKLIGQTIYL